jgi:hypothetical protein
VGDTRETKKKIDTQAAKKKPNLRRFTKASDNDPFHKIDTKYQSTHERFEQLPEAGDDASWNLLAEQLAERHRRSRILLSLKPAKLWDGNLTAEWRRTCEKFAKHMHDTMESQSGDDLAMLQLFLDFLELPTVVLGRILTDRRHKKNEEMIDRDLNHPDPAGTEAGGNRVHRDAVRLVRENRTGKAMQRLTSKGVAEPTRETLKIMRDMHPDRANDLKLHEPKTEQVRVSAKEARKFLFGMAASDKSALGPLGWSADFLFHVRGRDSSKLTVPTLIDETAELVKRVACADVPDAVALAMTCGGIFALNKLYPEEQQERERAGLKPKLRPVNVGVHLLKWAMKLALRDSSVKKAISAMSPIQMGLQARHGTETVGHLFRALHEKGFFMHNHY